MYWTSFFNVITHNLLLDLLHEEMLTGAGAKETGCPVFPCSGYM